MFQCVYMILYGGLGFMEDFCFFWITGDHHGHHGLQNGDNNRRYHLISPTIPGLVNIQKTIEHLNF